MTTTLSASTSSGFVVVPDNSGILQLQSGTSPALTIDNSLNVGIGTTSVLGNSILNVNLGITARTTSGSGLTPYLQVYNGNAGIDLKTWRIGGGTSGQLTIETINDAYTSATTRMFIDPNGNIGVGTTSPGARLEIKGDSTDNATININNNNGRIWKLWNDNGVNGLNFQFGGVTQLALTNTGSLTVFNLYLTSKFGVMGYANGTGASVTQLTSKSTGVALDNATGQIVMNNASLAAGTSVSFQCLNTITNLGDVVIASINVGSVTNVNNYQLTTAIGTGQLWFSLRNVSAGALAEAVTINYAIIRAQYQ